MGKRNTRRKKSRRRSSSGGGGKMRLSGMRDGMKSFVGTSTRSRKKESPLSRILTYLLIAAAVGVLVWRFLLN